MTSSNSKLWTRDQVKLAFHLYCQLPFGKLHSRNPEIIELAGLIGRTPSALAYKLVNLASLDPSITGSGRVGMKNSSKLDQEVWDEFNANWEQLAVECEQQRQLLNTTKAMPNLVVADEIDADFSGETRAVIIQQRIKQQFFRKAVLSSYRGRCCMTGVSDNVLLVASHIVPWSQDKANRLNPRNGLCLSTLHDRAFDQGLLTLDSNYRVLLSESLLSTGNLFLQTAFWGLQDQPIELPERFLPSPEFVQWHREHRFQGVPT
ncbi:putative restriction endonuclease [Fluviicoccus keumensis]|uniref:Putative restriction endonuclease n=1 Tax=Fluviicoccus keumensis TaxID=1435465 RepID=A0A4Q7YLI4_9GAMM|nr:HNH endonuclease [Fluviicoccus keumensis]RZU38427.1 putative restriction endonuclease [Fluviicoccus keumensis]